MKSETIGELSKALAKAQGQFEHAKKDTSNPFFKSKYADLAAVMDAARKPLSDNALAVTQITDFAEDGKLFLITTLSHGSGEWLQGRYPITPVKQDPQGVGSALTYARRYAFSAITGIATEDDDGNAASNKADKPTAKGQKSRWEEIMKGFDKIKDSDALNTYWVSITDELKSIKAREPESFSKLEDEKDRLKAKFSNSADNYIAATYGV